MAATLASLWDRKKKVQPSIVSPSVDLTIDTQHINSADPTCKKLATASRSGSAPSSSQNSEQPADGNKPSGLGQDRKRKRPDLTAEQTQILEALHSSRSCGDPSSEEINVAVSRTNLSEQLVKDLLDQKRKTKAQKATDHATTAAEADATGGRSIRHGTDAMATSPADDPSATLGPQNVAHDKSQQLLRQLDVTQQAAESLTKVKAVAAGNTSNADSQRQEQPQCSQSTRQHMLEQYQKELQSCHQQAKAVEPMAAVPHFTDGQLSRSEVCLLIPT